MLPQIRVRFGSLDAATRALAWLHKEGVNRPVAEERRS